MSIYIAIAIATLLLPQLLVFLLKANAAILFFALSAGVMLLDSLDPIAVSAAGSIVPGLTEAYVRLAVIVLSIAFAAAVTRGSVGMSMLPLHVLIAVGISALLLLLLPDATGVPALLRLSDQDLWAELYRFKTIILALEFMLSLVVILIALPKKHGKLDKKHKD